MKVWGSMEDIICMAFLTSYKQEFNGCHLKLKQLAKSA